MQRPSVLPKMVHDRRAGRRPARARSGRPPAAMPGAPRRAERRRSRRAASARSRARSKNSASFGFEPGQPPSMNATPSSSSRSRDAQLVVERRARCPRAACRRAGWCRRSRRASAMTRLPYGDGRRRGVQQVAELVDAVEQAAPRERIDREAAPSFAVGQRRASARSRSTVISALGSRARASTSGVHAGVDDDRHEPVLERVAAGRCRRTSARSPPRSRSRRAPTARARATSRSRSCRRRARICAPCARALRESGSPCRRRSASRRTALSPSPALVDHLQKARRDDLIGVDVVDEQTTAARRDRVKLATLLHHREQRRGSVTRPVTAAAAAVSGEARKVRPPLPWRPSKLRFEVRHRVLPGRELVAVHGDAHRAAGLAPLGARVAEDAVEPLGLGLPLDRLRARARPACARRRRRGGPSKHARRVPQIADAPVGARADEHHVDLLRRASGCPASSPCSAAPFRAPARSAGADVRRTGQRLVIGTPMPGVGAVGDHRLERAPRRA